MEKRIDVTIGYKIVEEGKPTRYFAGYCGEGRCYKDISAFKDKKGICYIPESEFEFGSGFETSAEWGIGYLKSDITELIRRGLPYMDIPEDEKFVERIAEYCLELAEWEGIEVVLDRLDLSEEWREFCEENQKISK